MTALQVQISTLLEKMGSPDKDFRFMATNDLMAELEKDSLKLDDDMERKITKMLLGLLDDKNGEVQNLAVRCLAPLVRKDKYVNIDFAIETLVRSLLTEDERYRDVSSLALKTALNEVGVNTNTAELTKNCLPSILNIFKSDKKQDPAFKIEVIDILGIIISKFGNAIDLDLVQIIEVLFYQISLDRQALRKRAISVLGLVSDFVDEALYEQLVQRVLNGVQTSTSPSLARSYVLAAGTISKSSKTFVKNLDAFVKALMHKCNTTDDDELKDACVHVFEVFISHCSKEITPYLAEIESICAKFIEYDPNYHYDDEEDESMEVDEESEEEDEDFDYSDDDDFSWKARRSAAKCYESLAIAPLLLNRFKEREESVKLEVFRAFDALLKQTRVFLPDSLAQFDTSANISPFSLLESKHINYTAPFAQKALEEDADSKQKAILFALSQHVPKFVKVISKQLRSKSSAVRLQCFTLLTSLIRVLPGCLAEHVGVIIPLVKQSLNEKSADNATKIDTLQFINLIFSCHEPEVFTPHLDDISFVILKCVNEPFYKVSSAALLVLQSFIIILKRGNQGENLLPGIYEVIVQKLNISDIDQEVKDRSIATAGVLLSHFGSIIAPKLSVILPHLLEKIGNEVSRQTTVDAFCVIVNSPANVDLSLVLEDLLLNLAEFLRKNQRSLRIATLLLLSSLVSKYDKEALPSHGISKVIQELPALMAENDLHVSQLSLKLAKDLAAKFPKEISASLTYIIKSCINLAYNSLLVGNMLQWAVELFNTIVSGDIQQKPDAKALLQIITENVYCGEKLPRQVYQAVAVIMSHIIKSANNAPLTRESVTTLIDQVNKSGDNDPLALFALNSLGELGRNYPEALEASPVNIDQFITDVFKRSGDDIKIYASFALGAIASGNLSVYLPSLLDRITTQPKKQYLYLHALKEVISSQSIETSDVFPETIDQVWQVLINHSSCTEESIRSVVAECLGRLCRMYPQKLLSQLISNSKSENQKQRLTIAAAVRFMIVDSKASSGGELRDNIRELLSAIDDPNLDVRRTTIMTLNSAAHNKPRWVKELLPSLLPSLYRETDIKKELVHEVQMGPFKHTVDDGLDLRKSAYECMYTLMEHCLDRIDVSEYMVHMEKGLKDSHDIKLLTLLMLTRLSQSCSAQVAQKVDAFIELINPMFQLKAKETSVKQESDKIEELKRACVRTVLALKKIPAMERSTKLQLCYDMVQADQKLKGILESLEKDNSLKHLSIHNQDVNMETS